MRALKYTAFAALVEEKLDLALRFLRKLSKYYEPLPSTLACQALALAQQGKWPLAQSLMERLMTGGSRYYLLFPEGLNRRWVERWLTAIRRWQPRVEPGRRTREAAHADKAKRDSPNPSYPAKPRRKEEGTKLAPRSILDCQTGVISIGITHLPRSDP